MKKSLGPFSGGQLTTIICVVVVMIMFPVGAWAVAGNNAFVTDAQTGKRATVDAAGNLHTAIVNPNAIPTNQFSIVPVQVFASPSGSPLMQPDPSGTRYAISSFTVTNVAGTAVKVQLQAISATVIDTGCSALANAVKTVNGPVVMVGANSTVSLSFPQPYVFGSSGAPQCLTAVGPAAAGTTWTAVGRKI